VPVCVGVRVAVGVGVGIVGVTVAVGVTVGVGVIVGVSVVVGVGVTTTMAPSSPSADMPFTCTCEIRSGYAPGGAAGLTAKLHLYKSPSSAGPSVTIARNPAGCPSGVEMRRKKARSALTEALGVQSGWSSPTIWIAVRGSKAISFRIRVATTSSPGEMETGTETTSPGSANSVSIVTVTPPPRASEATETRAMTRSEETAILCSELLA
jgi:hypothetical protein